MKIEKVKQRIWIKFNFNLVYAWKLLIKCMCPSKQRAYYKDDANILEITTRSPMKISSSRSFFSVFSFPQPKSVEKFNLMNFPFCLPAAVPRRWKLFFYWFESHQCGNEFLSPSSSAMFSRWRVETRKQARERERFEIVKMVKSVLSSRDEGKKMKTFNVIMMCL